MRKRNTLLFAIGAVMLFSCKQENTSVTSATEDNPELAHDIRIYEQAIKREDYQTAVYAMNSILLRDSTHTSLFDTLFQIYLGAQNFAASSDVGEKILLMRPNDPGLLDSLGVMNTYAGRFEDAIAKFTKSYGLKKDVKTLYRIAEVYMTAQNADKAIETYKAVINDPASEKELIEQPKPSFKDQTEKVKLKAVAYLSLANLYATIGNKSLAIANAEKAIEVEPNYDLGGAVLLELKYGKKGR